MNFDLTAAIAALDQTKVFQMANSARPAGNYLFNDLLPNRNEEEYDISGSAMTLITTMAGMSGMDAKYSIGGAARFSEFNGKTGKLTINQKLPEEQLRKLQRMLTRMQAQGTPTNQTIQTVALNFLDKLIIQALLDREEWLKGQALFTGKLDWTFNGKRMIADYNYPTDHMLTARTGTDAYGGSSSKFWEDYYKAQELLNWDIRLAVLHPTTLKDIVNNPDVNQLEFIATNVETGGFQFRKFRTIGGQTVVSTDPRDRIELLAYKEEGEIFDLANPGKTKKIPFCPLGAIAYIGEPISDSNIFDIGQGSTVAPDQETNNSQIQIGYGHVAPTVEGSGLPGRWSRVRVDANQPMQIQGDGVENFMPVIEANERVVIANTELQ